MAGGASRRADEDSRRNANAVCVFVCVASAVFVSEARFAGRSHTIVSACFAVSAVKSLLRVFRVFRGEGGLD